MGRTLYTFGYEGLSIESFIARLEASEVSAVLDVRALPLSRKRGFSKNSLNEALNEARIKYAHLPTMGCPKPIRDRYKEDGDWAAYSQSFLAYLEGNQESILELGRLAGKTTCCL